MNVIIYKRVSTDDQADRGFSLQHQQKVLTDFCALKGYTIIDIYTEDYSGKTFDRPQWKKLMDYIRKNKNKVNKILCLRWDRFSRNHYDSLTTIKELAKYNVVVDTVEQPLDLSNPDNKVLLSLYLTLPEIENDKNSIRTTEGMRRAKIEGCWTSTAPRGYLNARNEDDKSTLIFSKDAPLIKQSFERMASGAYSAEEVRRWLRDQGVYLVKQTFLSLIRNPTYMGKIRVQAWKNEPEFLAAGLHPPIVSEELFKRANEVLAGRKRNMRFHDDKSDLYPLKGFLMCPVHKTSLTAYGCRSRSQRIHHYYICNKCKESDQRHRISEVHREVEILLSQVELNAQILKMYRRTLEKVLDREDINRRVEMEKLNKEIDKCETRKQNLQIKFMDEEITSSDFHEMKTKIEKDLSRLKDRLNYLRQEGTPYKNYITKEVPMLENLVEFYRKADGKTKKKILGCIFSEKLIFEKGKSCNQPFSKPVSILLMIVNELQGSKKKKEVEIDLQSIMAPPAGLEPATL
jgi:site-specific DNA recombinase